MNVGAIEASLDLNLGGFTMKARLARKVLGGLGDDAAKAGDGFDKLDKDAEKTAGGMDRFAGQLRKVIGVMAAVQTVKKALDMGRQAASVKAATRVFEAAGGNLESLRKSTRGLVDDSTLMQKANLSQAIGLSGTDFGKLGEVAVAVSAATGKDLLTTLDAITKGVATQEQGMLKAAGVPILAADAFQRYADALGKGVGDLTAAERKQAFLNDTLAFGQKQLDLVARSGAQLADPFSLAAVSAANLQGNLDELVRQAVGPALTAFSETSNVIGDTVEKLTRLKPEVKAAIGEFASMAVTVTGAGVALASVGFAVVAIGPALMAAAKAALIFAVPLIKLIAIGAIVAGVAGLVGQSWKTASEDSRQNWSQFVDDVKQSAGEIKTFFGQVIDVIVAVFSGAINTIVNGVPFALKRSLAFIAGTGAKAAELFGFDDLSAQLKGFEGQMKTLATADKALFDGVAEQIQDQLIDIKGGKGGAATAAIGGVTDAITDAMPGIMAGVSGLMKDIGDGLSFIGGGAEAWLMGLLDGSTQAAATPAAAAALAETGTPAVNDFAAALDKASSEVMSLTDVLGPQIGKVITSLTKGMFGPETTKQIGTEVADGIGGLFSGGGLDVSSLGSAAGRAAGATKLGGGMLAKLLGSGAAAGGAVAGGGAAGGALGGPAAAIAVAAIGGAITAVGAAGQFLADKIRGAADAVIGAAAVFGDQRLTGAMSAAFNPIAIGAIVVGAFATLPFMLAAAFAPIMLAAFAPIMLTASGFVAVLLAINAPGIVLSIAFGAMALSVAFLVGGFAMLGGATASLITQTRAWEVVQASFAGAMDRLVEVLEPVAMRFVALGGAFDAFLDVIIPLFSAFDHGGLVTGALFETFKWTLVAAGALAIGFAVLANIPLQVATGLVHMAGKLTASVGHVVDGFGHLLEAGHDIFVNGFRSILGHLQHGIGEFFMLMAGSLGPLGASLTVIGAGLQEASFTTRAPVETENMLSGLAQSIFDASGSMHDLSAFLQAGTFDVDEMASALAELAGMSREEAMERGNTVARLRELNAELLNAPAGFALERARRQAIDPSGGMPSFVDGSVQARQASTMTIQNVNLAARDLGEFAEQIDGLHQSRRVGNKGTPVLISTLVQS